MTNEPNQPPEEVPPEKFRRLMTEFEKEEKAAAEDTFSNSELTDEEQKELPVDEGDTEEIILNPGPSATKDDPGEAETDTQPDDRETPAVPPKQTDHL